MLASVVEQIQNIVSTVGCAGMRLEIRGFSELRERLERLRVEDVMARALAEQAERLAAAIREELSEPSGAGGHDQPWLQSGALRDSVGVQADGLQAAVGSNDPAAVPQEMGTSHVPARPFLTPVAAGMGEEVSRAIANAVVAALKGEPPEGAITLAGASGGGRTHDVPYNALGLFQRGSPENEDWVHGTIQRLQELGRVLRSERQDSDSEDGGEGAATPDLPANPDDLLQQGWEEITHPSEAAAGHRSFRNKETGMVVRADKGEAGRPGNRERDHYHVYNPKSTQGKHDVYLDKNGRPVSRGSNLSHIIPGEKP